MKEQQYIYRAFISYRHVDRDRKWAKWLMLKLETYRVPKGLVGAGMPNCVGKIFRDDDEIPASSDLGSHLEDALRDSEYLIVICSQDTPISEWVRREIILFQEMGKSDRIIPLLVDGEPGQSFPPELLYLESTKINEDGIEESFKKNIEPLAADVRERNDEPMRVTESRALLRIIAALLGCRFDDLAQREKFRRKRRERNRVIAIVCASLALVIFLMGLVFAYEERSKRYAINEIKTAESLKEVSRRADLLANIAKDQGNPATGLLLALEAWNYADPRPNKKYFHYLDLNVPARLEALRHDWVESEHYDPSFKSAAAIARKAANESKEIFYRRYMGGDISVDFSRDYSLAGIGYDEGEFFIEDVKTQKLILKGQVDGEIRAFYFDDNKHFVYIFSKHEIIKIDLNTKLSLFDYSLAGELWSYSISPNRKEAVIGSRSGHVEILNLEHGTTKVLRNLGSLPNVYWGTKLIFVDVVTDTYGIDISKENIGYMKFNLESGVKKIFLDEKYETIGIALNNDVVKLINTSTKPLDAEELFVEGMTRLTGIEIDRDNKQIFASMKSHIEIRSISAESKKVTLNCGEGEIVDISLVEINGLFASATDKGWICIWSTRSHDLLWKKKVTSEEILEVKLSSENAKFFFSTRDGELHGWYWDEKDNTKLLDDCNGEISTLHMSYPPVRYLLSSSSILGVCVWDLENDFEMKYLSQVSLSDKLHIPVFKDSFVTIDRYGIVIEYSLPTFEKTIFHAPTNVVFHSVGYSVTGELVIGYAIDGYIYVWNKFDPDDSTVLSMNFDVKPIKAISNSKKYLGFVDDQGAAYIFSGTSGALLLTINLDLNIISLVIDKPTQSVFVTLSDGLLFRLPFDQLISQNKVIKSTQRMVNAAEFQKYGYNAGNQVSSPYSRSSVKIFDLDSGYLIYDYSGEDHNVESLSGGIYREGTISSILAGIVNTHEQSDVSQVIVHQVPEIIGRRRSLQAVSELNNIEYVSNFEDDVLLKRFWTAESEDWVFNQAKNMTARCLTPLQRKHFKLIVDPPCWCSSVPFPSRKMWSESLGRDPFSEKRLDGSVCASVDH